MLFVPETDILLSDAKSISRAHSAHNEQERTVILLNQGLWIPHPSSASALLCLPERCHMASSPRALSPGSQTQVNVMLLWNCKSHLESSIIAVHDNDKCCQEQEHRSIICPCQSENHSSSESMLNSMAVSLQVHTGKLCIYSKQLSNK